MSRTEARPLADTAPGRIGRDGALALRFERRGGATVLASSRSRLPLQILAPVALADPAAVAWLLNPSGGVLGGDRLEIEVELDAGAHACVTTPSATRIYRAVGEPAVQSVRLRIGAGATAEWVPDHTIPYAGADFRQSIDVEVGEGATLVLLDAFAAGRVARHEAWRFARLESALRVRDATGWIALDRFVLEGGARWDGLGFAEGRPYFASLLVVADRGLDAFCAEVAAAAPTDGRATAAVAGLSRRGALVRCLALTAPALAGILGDLWALARRHLLDLPPLDLRKF